MSTGADLCAVVMASCECVRAEGHEEPHVCSCNGSWTSAGDILAFPEGRSVEEAVSAFVDLLYFPMTSRFGGLFYDGSKDEDA